MSWGQDPQDPQDRERDFDPWNTAQGRSVPATEPQSGDDRWGGDARPERLRPLSLGDVLDGTFRIARTHWRAFALGLGVVVVPLSLLSGFVLAQMFGAPTGLFDSLQDPEVAQSITDEQGLAQLTSAIAGSGLAGLAGLLLTPLIYGIAVYIAARGYREGTVDPMDAVRAAGRRYLPLLGTAILLGVVPVLVFIPPALLLAGAAVGTAELLLVVGGIGLVVALIVAVIVAVRFTVAIPALMLEGAGPLQALRRSNSLIKGRTGFVLGTLVVVYIVITIVGLVLGLPFQVIGGVFGSTATAIAVTAGNIVTSILSNTLMGIAIVLIYFDRRVRAEGYDLSELAEDLGDAPDTQW